MERISSMYTQQGVWDPNPRFSKIVQFLQFQKERIERDYWSHITHHSKDYKTIL